MNKYYYIYVDKIKNGTLNTIECSFGKMINIHPIEWKIKEHYSGNDYELKFWEEVNKEIWENQDKWVDKYKMDMLAEAINYNKKI